MTRNTLAIGLALLLAVSIQASTVVLIKKPAGAFCSTTGNTLWWRAEATDFTSTDGTLDNSAGDSDVSATPAPTGTVALSATAAKMGSNGIITDGADDYYALTVSSGNVISGTQGTIAFWWRWPSGGTINLGRIIEMRVDSSNHLRIVGASSGSNHIRAEWFATGALAGNAISGTLTVNTWYFVVVKYDSGQAAGSDVLSIYIYSTAGSLVTSDVSAAETLGPFNPSALRMGSVGGSIGTHLDQVMVWSTTTATPENCMNQANYNGS